MKQCDPKKLDIGMYTSVLNNLNPIIETVERDKELYDMLILARKYIINKMFEMSK